MSERKGPRHAGAVERDVRDRRLRAELLALFATHELSGLELRASTEVIGERDGYATRRLTGDVRATLLLRRRG